MTARTVTEWRGGSPDSAIPARVRVRIFDRYEGRCQCGCNRRINVGEAWDCDHVVALVNAGEHRENNLRPVLREHHKIKSRSDVAEKSRVYKRRASHVGVKKAKQPIRGWRKFSGEPVINPKLRSART